MKLPFLKLASIAVASLPVLFILAVLVGCFIDPRKHFVTLGKSNFVTVWNRGIDSRIVYFDDAACGPYGGSIVALEGSEQPSIEGFGDTFGVYYRRLEWESPEYPPLASLDPPEGRVTRVTLMVSMWYPIIGLSIVLGALLGPMCIGRNRSRFQKQKPG